MIFKKVILSFICLYGCGCVCAVADSSHRPRVAVVLSGGGAKGVAHISVLQMIEETGIPVDYVVGTSMGAIIGGLYAIGYAPTQLDSLVREQDWDWLLSDKPKRIYRTLTAEENESRYILSVPLSKRVTLQKPESLAKGQNIGDLLAELTVGYHDSISFHKLPIPFACIATDITDGHEVVLEHGVLAEAMRASMAIPGVFSPMRKNGMVLVDGGLINNYPVDVARRMGADIVIGVDVQEGLQSADGLNSLPEILTQIVDIACTNKHEANKKQTDVYIKVDVRGYSSSSFTKAAIDTLIRRGKEAALRNRAQLLTIKERVGNNEKPHSFQHSFHEWENLYVSDISFEGILPKDAQWIISKCRLYKDSYISQSQIEQTLTLLRNELNYSEASFRLYAAEEGYRLLFRLAEKNATTLNLSARFDTEEVASLLLNSSFYWSGKIPSTLTVTGKLGKQYMASLGYSLHPSLMRDISLVYTYRHCDINFYEQGDKSSNASYNYHVFEFGYSSEWFHNFRYHVGIAYELYHNTNILYRETSPHYGNGFSDNVFKYFVSLNYNTQNRSFFPVHGIRFFISGAAYTDDMVRYRDDSPFYAIAGDFSGAWPLTDRFTVLPGVHVRVLVGDNIPQVYRNLAGGETSSRYLGQQIPFMGVGYAEFVNDTFATGSVQLRYRFGERHYLSFIGNVASNTDKLKDFGQGKILYGIGTNYAFDSRFGPLSLSVGYSNLTNEFYCFGNIGYYF